MPIINQQQALTDIQSQTFTVAELLDNQPIATNINEVLLDIRQYADIDSQKLIECLEKIKNQSSQLKNIGIILAGDVDLQQIEPVLSKILLIINVIVIDFAVFRDGRGYSLIKAIRQLTNFHQQIIWRAMGYIIPDTLPLLAKVGFSQFVIADELLTKDYFNAFDVIRHDYDGGKIKQLPMFSSLVN